MTLLSRGVGVALVIAGTITLAWASRAPMTAYRSPDAMLRLAWSARPERIEKCRQQSEEELAKIPQHMRQPVACEGVTAEYRLQVRVDDVLVTERLVHGGGMRRDRRLYIFEELSIPAGEATIDVRLDRVETEDTRDRAEKSDRGDVPPHLVFAERLRLTPREVVLVTYDSSRRTLTAMTSSSHDSGHR